MGIAYASLGELLEDYEDFLRQRGLKLWSQQDLRIREFRQTTSLEEKFVKEGGFTENLFKRRMEERRKK